MKRLLFLLLWCCTTIALSGQNGAPIIAGAKGAAMGNASVSFTDINSIFSNQAGLAYLQETAVILVGQRRFQNADINSYAIGAAYPTNSGTFGLNLQYYGFDVFNEQKVGLSYARKLFDRLAIGAQVDYLTTRIPEYGSATNLTFEFGVHSQIMEDFFLAAQVYSPIQVDINETDQLPTIFKLGIAYNFSEKLEMHLEGEKDLDFPTMFKVGFQYQVVSAFYLRAGISTNPSLWSFGLAYEMKNGLSFDIASSYHQILGVSPAISVRYQFKK